MKKPKLVPEWKRVIKKAWSVRFSILAALFSAVEFALPYFAPETPSGTFAAFALFAALGAAISRIISQVTMHDDSSERPTQAGK